KPIPRDRCASSPPRAPPARQTFSHGLSRRGSRGGSVSNSWSKTAQVAAPISAPKRRCERCRTATHFLLMSTTNAINATLYDRLNFDFLRDIAPVAGLISLPFVMVVNPSVPAKTVAGLAAYAKANPGKINLGSPGIGTPGHVAGELFKMMA